MGIQVSIYGKNGFPESDIIIDALLGYSLRGNPREPISGMIRKANDHGASIISLDLPSGLNALTGEVMEPCINADYTMTLAYPKTGLKENPEVVGQLFIADIGLPSKLYRELGLEKPPFFTQRNIF